jgi:hypothetical protein
MKLHTTAAYLRKHSALPDISSLTNVRLCSLRPTLRTTLRLSFSCKQQFTCPVVGVENPSSPSETARLARPAGHQQRGAPSGTVHSTFLLHKTLTRDHLPQPPSGKVHALPLRHLFPRRPPELLHAVLRKDAVSFAPDVISTFHGIAAEDPPSPCALNLARRRRHHRFA